MVNEFPEVFPDDLPGIPSNKEIKFRIDFVMDTSLIFISPYRMALAGLKELKEKLKDPLHKGFIYPSVSA